MKIVYDYQIFAKQHYGGISRYIYEVATRLCRRQGLDVKILACAYINQYLRQCQGDLLIGFPASDMLQKSQLISFLDYVLAKSWLSRRPPDILHRTYYSPGHLAPAKTKTIITVYDMIHEKMATERRESGLGVYKSQALSAIKKRAVEKSDHVICISENTKKDLVELFDVSPAKVSVIHLGFDLQTPGETEPAQSNIPQKTDPYILYVGKRGWYKNFSTLLQAYAALPALQRDFQLVAFGDGPFSAQEQKQISALKIQQNQVRYVSGNDAVLARLYQKASVFVYPSLYEGFGIPPLEAMSFGCPVACSNTSSLPEVVGDAAELFDPSSAESIGAALEKVLYSPDAAPRLIRRGKERIKQFSWEACAEQTYQVYASLCSE